MTDEIKIEEKKAEPAFKRWLRNPLVIGIVALVVITGIIVGFIYWQTSQSRIFTNKAAISAQAIILVPHVPGILKNTFVSEGDFIKANTVVAQTGDEIIKTAVDSEVITVNKNIGKIINPGEAVVTVIDPSDLRVVGAVEENKGLSDIQVGQRAIFTVDAFGSKQYVGVIDEVSPTVKAGDIVFNISDKRQVQEFNVMVRFNTDAYPELKNGMSASMWIYKK
jgi:multidrug resistance efflux pump